MSLMAKVRALIAGIEDTHIRVDVATSIKYLFELYADGRAREQDILDDLRELLASVLSETKPEATPDEIMKLSSVLAEEFIRTFKVEGSARRLMSKYRGVSTV